MSNFDKQLSRMEYLMGFRMPKNESKSNIEFSAEAADGKRYGILREGTKYYIKVCNDASKANIAESYDYINGITSKKEHEYKSYNEATKQLELKLMSLNEAYNGNKKTSTVDFKSNEKVFANLTEEARKELNRMHAILENSMTIGMKNTGNPEAPKTAAFTPTIGKPFEEGGKAELDKDFKKTAEKPEKMGNPFNKEESVTDADMESDKAPRGGEADGDMKKAEFVPQGSVADKKPAGGKVVRVNESDEEEILGIDDDNAEIAEPVEDDVDYLLDSDEELESLLSDDGTFYGEEPLRDDEYDFEADEDEFEDGLEAEQEENMPMESKRFSLNRIVESVCENLMDEIYDEDDNDFEWLGSEDEIDEEEEMDDTDVIPESVTKHIEKMVKEEILNLNVFGKHPGYRKEPMTTPSPEKAEKNGSKDWNDASAKGKKPFGSKIGKGAPFTQAVNVLTDAVMKTLKEGLKKK